MEIQVHWYLIITEDYLPSRYLCAVHYETGPVNLKLRTILSTIVQHYPIVLDLDGGCAFPNLVSFNLNHIEHQPSQTTTPLL